MKSFAQISIESPQGGAPSFPLADNPEGQGQEQGHGHGQGNGQGQGQGQRCTLKSFDTDWQNEYFFASLSFDSDPNNRNKDTQFTSE